MEVQVGIHPEEQMPTHVVSLLCVFDMDPKSLIDRALDLLSLVAHQRTVFVEKSQGNALVLSLING